jgi:hypothetical protein
MNKLLILTLVLLSVLSNVVYAEPSDSQVVTSFKQYVSEEVNKAISTYEPDDYRVDRYNVTTVSGHGSTSRMVWRKSYHVLHSQYTVDLRKNDSLISPYIGTMEIPKTVRVYEDCATKEEAEKTTAINYTTTFKYKFTVAYQDNNWVVTKVQSDNWDTKTMGIYETLKYK